VDIWTSLRTSRLIIQDPEKYERIFIFIEVVAKKNTFKI
jgi:hypothetical protein